MIAVQILTDDQHTCNNGCPFLINKMCHLLAKYPTELILEPSGFERTPECKDAELLFYRQIGFRNA